LAKLRFKSLVFNKLENLKILESGSSNASFAKGLQEKVWSKVRRRHQNMKVS